MTPRALSDSERAVLDFLLTREFTGRDELRAQAESVQTTGLSCTCGCPSFKLEADRSLPPAPVSDQMPSDAHGTDPAGSLIGVLLLVDDGYLSEVEVYSRAGDDFAGLPTPANLTLSQWSERDARGTSFLLNP